MTTKSIFLKLILVHLIIHHLISVPPTSNFTLVFEVGRCYKYIYTCIYYCRFIVYYAIPGMASLTDNYLFVAVIDFGTTFSGYAFSPRDDFKKGPLKIVAKQAWNGGSLRHF